MVEVTSHEFDDKDRPLRTITEIYEPFFVYAGRMSLEWVFDDSHVIFGNESLLVERTVEEFTYAGELSIPEGFKPGQDVSEPVVYQRTSRYTYQAWGKTQGGSQGPAESTTLEAFTSASEVISFVFGSLGLVLTDSEVTANKVFGPKGQQRPGEVDRAVEQGTLDGQGREIKYVEIQFSNDGDQSRSLIQPATFDGRLFHVNWRRGDRQRLGRVNELWARAASLGRWQPAWDEHHQHAGELGCGALHRLEGVCCGLFRGVRVKWPELQLWP